MNFNVFLLFFICTITVQSQNSSEFDTLIKQSKIKVLAFKILPNPVVSKCELVVASDKEVLVEVFDVTGDIIYRKENVKNRLELHTSNWVSGSYIVRITNEDTSIIKRLIKL